MSDDAIDSTDSPEIGPPPVSQFVEEDPVKIDLAIRPHNPDNEEIPGLNPALSANRRRAGIQASRQDRTKKWPRKHGFTKDGGKTETGCSGG
jgi:hypothetical protein